jgi:hypothetical protein
LGRAAGHARAGRRSTITTAATVTATTAGNEHVDA